MYFTKVMRRIYFFRLIFILLKFSDYVANIKNIYSIIMSSKKTSYFKLPKIQNATLKINI